VLGVVAAGNDRRQIMEIALWISVRGDRGEVPVGAVLVGGDRVILARDGNRIVQLADPTATRRDSGSPLRGTLMERAAARNGTLCDA